MHTHKSIAITFQKKKNEREKKKKKELTKINKWRRSIRDASKSLKEKHQKTHLIRHTV